MCGLCHTLCHHQPRPLASQRTTRPAKPARLRAEFCTSFFSVPSRAVQCQPASLQYLSQWPIVLCTHTLYGVPASGCLSSRARGTRRLCVAHEVHQDTFRTKKCSEIEATRTKRAHQRLTSREMKTLIAVSCVALPRPQISLHSPSIHKLATIVEGLAPCTGSLPITSSQYTVPPIARYGSSVSNCALVHCTCAVARLYCTNSVACLSGPATTRRSTN